MAAVVEPKDTAAKHNSQVDEQIAQATSRIRTHDLAFGGLALAALALVYATAMIVLDRYLNLPEWVRQVALVGFGALFAGTAYLTLLSPLRKRINPLYAAKKVEGTIDDPKNSVTGYVDAREKGDLNATVKAALASRAAKAAAEADVNRAVDHRSLIWLGGVAIAFLLTLIVLFFVFRPSQFASLVSRTFVPFTARPIETRTKLTLVKPDPAEPTITVGQSVTVAVFVEGKVPKAEAPDRVRLLVRHNPADPNYDELPMTQGDTSRDWELRVPDYLVQNGFWYKVAGGDYVTPEYKVTVRSLPMFASFRATYEYPKYLRRPNDTTDDPVLKGYRGTTVTLVAKTNRDVRDGLMEIAPGNLRVVGTPVPGQPDSVQFVFKLGESGKYKLNFTATNGERTIDPFQGVITVESDNAPQIVINKPEDDETTEPANGQVKIDGKVGDDFGIDTVTLKMKVVAPVEIPLPDKPYLNGKSASFRRDKDKTYPTDLDYKDSIDLAGLKKAAGGVPVELKPDMVIEYWLEATDNCTEPKPNVGASKPKRVRLTPPKVEPMEQKNLDEQKQNRKTEEKKHNDDQQKKLDNEKREPKKGEQQGKKDDAQPEPKAGDKGDGNKDDAPPKPMGGMPENPPQAPMPGDKGDNPPPKKDGMPDAAPGMGDPMKNDTKQPDAKTDPKGGPKNNTDKDIDKTAKEVQDDVNRENQDGGRGKPNPAPPEKDRTDPAQSKPQPKDGGTAGMNDPMNDPSAPKPEPKQPKSDPANPMGKTDSAPSTAKPEGDLQKPQDPSEPKPQPKTDGKTENRTPPAEARGEPAGMPPGTDKPTPKEPQPEPKDPNAKQDPNSGSCPKPSTQKKDGSSGGTPDAKSDPAADAGSKSKPMQEPTRGGEKPPQPQPKDPNAKQPDDKPGAPDAAGEPKPQKGPPPADAKPQPKDGAAPKGMDPETKPAPGANDPTMKPNATPAAESRPDEPKKDNKGDPMAGGKPVEKGMERPQPQPKDKDAAGGNPAPMPKTKMDEQQRKELEQAAKDLAGNDESKKAAAREKLDKAIGEQNRKEMEKMANDLKSPDPKTRADAEQKLKDMMEKAGDKKDDTTAGGGPKKDEPKELTPEQKKEIEQALNDLQNPDPKKQQEAREKLDRMVGQKNREEAEQLMKDLKSDDPMKQKAAQKKLDDIKKQMDDKVGGKGGKNDSNGKAPTPEDINDLAKKAQDLQSKDEGKQKQAQKDLDEKLGREQREKLEEMMKNQKAGDPMADEKLKEQLKEMAKNAPKKPSDDFKPMGPGSSPAAKGPMEEDAANRLKALELMLDRLQQEEYRKRLQERKGWTDAEMKKFMEDAEKHVDDLRKEAEKERLRPVAPGPKEAGAPIGPIGGDKVDNMGGASGAATGGGVTTPPPGFDGTRDKFQKALPKKP